MFEYCWVNMATAKQSWNLDPPGFQGELIPKEVSVFFWFFSLLRSVPFE